jgi:hypothetical protein
MSLTLFVELPPIRKAIDEAMHFPRLTGRPPLQADPKSTRYGLVGAAYDYLLRFTIEQTNRGKTSATPWVADRALQRFLLQSNALVLRAGKGESSLDLESSLENLDPLQARLAIRIREVLDKAHKRHNRFLLNGVLEDGLYESALHLASLEVLLRTGQLPEEFDVAWTEDVEDLRNLITATPIQKFQIENIGVLNPSFGEGSVLVGGADGDLFIDGKLIEVKVSKAFPLRKDWQRQIVGYVVLAHIGGIDGLPESQDIVSGVGYYAARFGELATFELAEVLDVMQLPQLTLIFRQQMAAMNRANARHQQAPGE